MIELLVDAALAELQGERDRMGTEVGYPGRSIFSRIAGAFRSDDELDQAERMLAARRSLRGE